MTTPPFDLKKNLEEAIKEGLVITGAAVGIFWLLKMGKIASPPKAALDASDIIKLSRGVITGVFLKDYAPIRSGYDLLCPNFDHRLETSNCFKTCNVFRLDEDTSVFNEQVERWLVFYGLSKP